MTKLFKTQVCIVGAGPVGLTLAMDLAKRGIKVLIAETRYRNEPPNVKCNHVSARSMEIFRKLGIVQEIRNTGLPGDFPNDVAYKTSFIGEEIARIKIPCRNERYTSTDGPDTWWPTPEPPHRINQIYLEPKLFECAEKIENITILNRTEVQDYIQNEYACNTYALNLDTNEGIEIQSDFLIGCDGGRSIIRKKIGTKLSGVAEIGKVKSTYIRAPQLIHMSKTQPSWASFTVNPRRSGNVYAIDGKETWLLHCYLKHDEKDFKDVDRDQAIRDLLGVDESFEYEIISKEDWIGRRLVADKFRDKRVFICGDAAHLWIPMAGYGMNAGIADAVNLSWCLAAYLEGWGGENILDMYEKERQPITQQVSNFAMNHAVALLKEQKNIPENIEDDSPEAQQVRIDFGKSLYDLNVKQYCCAGLNFGYFYDNSPIIIYDNEKHPTYEIDKFQESTVPGCRLPHFWMNDNTSLYDHFDKAYILLKTSANLDHQSIEHQAKSRNISFKVIDISMEKNLNKDLYKTNYILVRSDQHISWRGDHLPEDIDGLIDVLVAA